VTVEQICAAAGIAPATFYRYFGTKDGVLFAYRPAGLQVIRETVAGLPAGLGRGEQLRRAVEGFLRFLDEHAEAMSARDEIVARNPVLLPRTLLVQREWEDELAGALARARGVPASDPDVRLDAALGLLVVRMAFRRWRAGGAPSLTSAVPAAFAEVTGAVEAHRGSG
jgi:AcrR family transcriptional regulator